MNESILNIKAYEEMNLNQELGNPERNFFPKNANKCKEKYYQEIFVDECVQTK